MRVALALALILLQVPPAMARDYAYGDRAPDHWRARRCRCDRFLDPSYLPRGPAPDRPWRRNRRD